MQDTSLRAALLILNVDGEPERTWCLTAEVTTIGRLDDNDVPVPDRWVSRHHAEIHRQGTRYEIVDLDSKNGLFLNGSRVAERALLQDGDQIAIAPRCVLTFVDSESTAPTLRAQRGVRVDADACRVWVNGCELAPPLSSRQFALLTALVARPGHVYARNDLVSLIWPDEDPSGISDEALNSLVRRLRKRLTSVDPSHRYIYAVRGHGLRLEQP